MMNDFLLHTFIVCSLQFKIPLDGSRSACPGSQKNNSPPGTLKERV
nr:MAG TPA: hypothetical protein [Caudoviricetes sp.]